MNLYLNPFYHSVVLNAHCNGILEFMGKVLTFPQLKPDKDFIEEFNWDIVPEGDKIYICDCGSLRFAILKCNKSTRLFTKCVKCGEETWVSKIYRAF